jgi:hypothetical protein
VTRPGTGCLLCGTELCYRETACEMDCALCGAHVLTSAACKEGHFVCDACHGASGRDLIERRCAATAQTDPIGLATELMRSPAIAMHGPEHHFLVPAVLLAAYDNSTGRTERRAADVQEARRRAEKVPGGFCGTHGNCGAAVGSGIFWSIVTGTTPLSDATWADCNAMTARTLLRIAEHGGPRCCKRDTYHALLQAMDEIRQLDPTTNWPPCPTPTCEHSDRNRQCLSDRCAFHPDRDS